MKSRKLGLIFFLVLTATAKPCLARQNRYDFLWDRSLSSTVGAANLTTFHRGITGLTGLWLKPRWSAEDNFGKKFLGLSYRLSKTILLDNVLDHMTFLIQHEVFGHGARYREFGYTDNTYRLHFVFPYGDNKGWAFRGIPDPSRKITDSENLLMTIGGFDAESLFSKAILFNWLEKEAIHYRETGLYLFTSLNLSSQILRTKYHLGGHPANDVLTYLNALNTEIGIPEERHDQLTIDQLAGRTWINVLNPFLFYSLYAYFVRYLWMGDETMPLPMISLGGFKVLPCFRFRLAPYGTEFYLESYAAFSERAARFYIRYGPPDFHKAWGAGLSIANLFRRSKFSFGTKMDVWSQPSILLGGENVEKSRAGLGGAILGNLFFKLTDRPFKMGITGHLGYKTAGYLEGDKLGRGIIVRAGLGFFD